MSACRFFLVLAFAVAACSCSPGPTLKAQSDSSSEPDVKWVEVGTWHGRGAMQTESFVSDAGMLRVRWSADRETQKDAGKLRLNLSSGISGRVLETLADQHGLGRGEAFSAETGRPMFIAVESSDVDWTFTVEEAFILIPPSALHPVERR